MREDFIVLDEDGSIHRILCKVCGNAVAGFTEGVDKKLKFRRFASYAEIKIICDDGSAHVTNGCGECLSMGLSADMLNKLLQIDALEQQRDEGRKALRVVSIDKTGSGLV